MLKWVLYNNFYVAITEIRGNAFENDVVIAHFRELKRTLKRTQKCLEKR